MEPRAGILERQGELVERSVNVVERAGMVRRMAAVERGVELDVRRDEPREVAQALVEERLEAVELAGFDAGH